MRTAASNSRSMASERAKPVIDENRLDAAGLAEERQP
jgi:hypothetical protein